MKDIIILVDEKSPELVEKVKKVEGISTELRDNNFDGDQTMLAFLITVTPVVITQLAGIIKIIIQNSSKGKIKIDGIEIEGFTYEEVMEILEKISKTKED